MRDTPGHMNTLDAMDAMDTMDTMDGGATARFRQGVLHITGAKPVKACYV